MSVAETLAAILGPLVGGRAYPVLLPQDMAAWPAIRYTAYLVPANTNCGSSDLGDYRIQVDVFGSDYDEVAALGQKDGPVCLAVEGAFESFELVAIDEDYEADGRLFRRRIEYSVAAA